MSDELDDLKAAMRAATPAPDPRIKADHLALASRNFASAQGSGADTRPMSDRPRTGIWTGVRDMLNSFSPRAALVATSALIAVGAVMDGYAMLGIVGSARRAREARAG